MDDFLYNDLVRPFWDAAEQGKLVTCCCDHCVKDIWYPMKQCPVCGGASNWRQLNGRAHLLSWTTVRKQLNGQFAAPYIPAIVIPEDAPEVQLVTCLSLSEGAMPYCDMPLEVTFTELVPLQGSPFMAPVFAAVK